jgi:Ran GTPase-activating protein (RanGAP) involved in mRNA processing and transport
MLVGSIMINILKSHNIITNLKIYGNQMRNSGLRMIVFKEKKYPIFLENLKKIYEIYYLNSIVYFNEKLYEYNNISENDKIIIESIINLLY